MKTNHFKTLDLIPTRREYRLFFSMCQPSGHPTDHSLISIIRYSLEDDYEWAHAIMDTIDDVLDLRINESMTFATNRDDKSPQKEIAIIKRIR